MRVNDLAVRKAVMRIYRITIHSIFYFVIITLLIALFIGVIRTTLNLLVLAGENDLMTGFKEFISAILYIIVIIELVKVFVEYFEYERVRLGILTEVIIAFTLREMILKVFEMNVSGLDIFFWSMAIFALIGGRVLILYFNLDKSETPYVRKIRRTLRRTTGSS